MKTLILKYGTKLGCGDTAVFYPPGTILEQVEPDGMFCELKKNLKSSIICVRFPGRSHSTLIHESQVIVSTEG